MLTPADLAAIRARLDAATPGPWAREGLSVSVTYPCSEGWEVADCGTSRSPDTAQFNADLIAHAPADLAALLDEVELLRAQLLDWNEELRRTAEVLHREPMDAHALHEVAAEIVAERDEAVAALANERGEGEPPGEGWAWDGAYWRSGPVVVKRYEDIDDGWGAWEGRISHTDHGLRYSAREAMRAADRAQGRE